MSEVHALVLAAGAGRRFGGGKLVIPWKGKPLIQWSVAAAWASGVDGVTVVLGADADHVASVLEPDIKTVMCNDWEKGIAASLRCGLASLPRETTAVLIFLGDMPNVPSALGRSLLNLVEDGAPAALAWFHDVPAHPVAVNRSAFALLAKLRGDCGARSLLATLPGVRYMTTSVPGSVFDVDYRSDASERSYSRLEDRSAPN